METYAAPGFIGADFGDLENRVLAAMVSTSQVHDETIVEYKTDVSARVALKQLQGYASLFGLTDAQKLQMASVAYQPGSGIQAINRLARFKRMRHMSLFPERRCWAKAFEDVLGVGNEFYVNARVDRKDYLERHYTELANHNTRKGRKAAKVVAARVMYALEDEEPKKAHDDYIDPLTMGMKFHGSATGRMSMPSLNNIPKSKFSDRLFGKSFDKIIVDELTDWTVKKP